jgi:hypothetical protein
MVNELGRLLQGLARAPNFGTNTIVWIRHTDVPTGRTITYARVVCDIQPQKDEVHRTRVTVGGNLIDYPGEISTWTHNCKTCHEQHHFDQGCLLPWIRHQELYLNTPLDRYEYMRFPLWMIPKEIRDQYKIADLVHNG